MVLQVTWLYMQGLRRVPNMFDYDSQYNLMSLNIREHGLILLNMPQYA